VYINVFSLYACVCMSMCMHTSIFCTVCCWLRLTTSYKRTWWWWCICRKRGLLFSGYKFQEIFDGIHQVRMDWVSAAGWRWPGGYGYCTQRKASTEIRLRIDCFWGITIVNCKLCKLFVWLLVVFMLYIKWGCKLNIERSMFEVKLRIDFGGM